MKTNKLTYTLLAALLMGFTACDDDDSIFSGDENYLTSFALTQDDQTYTALISSDSIIVTISESITLDHATATYLCSENATISPDPATIENWENDQTFTVTSYNGSQRHYYYTLQHTASSVEGLTLLNDADVEALAATGVSRIEGNLIIGSTSGSDTITTLAPLENLTEVTGTIYIYPTFAASSLDGLENLTNIGGMEIYHSSTSTCYYPNFKSQVLPSLISVQNNLNLLLDTTSIVSMPLLESVGGNVQIKGVNIAQIELPQLRIVGGSFTVSHIRSSSASLAGLETLSLSQLTMVNDDLEIGSTSAMTTCEMPQLEFASNLAIYSNYLESLELPKLTQVINEIYLYTFRSAHTISMPLLTSAGGIYLYSAPSLTTLDFSRLETLGETGLTLLSVYSLTNLDGFSSLKTVQGRFYLNVLGSLSDLSGANNLTYVGGDFTLTSLSSEITDFDAFNNLTTVGGTFSLRSLTGITTISGLQQLSYVGGNITIYACSSLTSVDFITQLAGQSFNTVNVQSLSELQALDITGVDISTLQIQSCGEVTVTGDEVLNCSIYVSMGKTIRFNGIKQVNAVNINSLSTTTDSDYIYDFSGLEVVTGDVTVNQTYYANSGTVRFSNLRSIGGTLSITDGTYNMVMASQFPALEDAGAITFSGVVDTFSMPNLTTVSNALTINTRYTTQSNMLETIDLPRLTSVGELIIKTQSTTANTMLTNLDGFASLQTAGKITVTNQSALTSYTGLRTAIASLTDSSSWEVSSNGYNPTWEDIQAGLLELEE